MIIKNDFIHVGQPAKLVQFDDLDDLKEYLKAHYDIEEGEFTKTTVHGEPAYKSTVGTYTRDTIIIEDGGEFPTTVSRYDFDNNYILYNPLPDNVAEWLYSAICQNLSLVEALGEVEPNSESDSKDYSKLTLEVLTWLENPTNQLSFATQMALGQSMTGKQVRLIYKWFNDKISL